MSMPCLSCTACRLMHTLSHMRTRALVHSAAGCTYHIISQDAPLALSVLPEEELDTSPLVGPQVAVDAAWSLQPELRACHSHTQHLLSQHTGMLWMCWKVISPQAESSHSVDV